MKCCQPVEFMLEFGVYEGVGDDVVGYATDRCCC
jgi:hypothetical protein